MYSPIIPDYSPIIPALCLMLVRAYYFQNYAGIIRPTLSSSKIKNKPGLKHFPSSYKTQGIYKHSLTGSLLEAVGLYTINALFFFQLFHAHKRAAASLFTHTSTMILASQMGEDSCSHGDNIHARRILFTSNLDPRLCAPTTAEGRAPYADEHYEFPIITIFEWS